MRTLTCHPPNRRPAWPRRVVALALAAAAPWAWGGTVTFDQPGENTWRCRTG